MRVQITLAAGNPLDEGLQAIKGFVSTRQGGFWGTTHNTFNYFFKGDVTKQVLKLFAAKGVATKAQRGIYGSIDFTPKSTGSIKGPVTHVTVFRPRRVNDLW